MFSFIRETKTNFDNLRANTKIEELENSIEDKFTEQPGKLVSLEEKVNEDRMELTEKSEENKLIVQKFTKQQDSTRQPFQCPGGDSAAQGEANVED